MVIYSGFSHQKLLFSIVSTLLAICLICISISVHVTTDDVDKPLLMVDFGYYPHLHDDSSIPPIVIWQNH